MAENNSASGLVPPLNNNQSETPGASLYDRNSETPIKAPADEEAVGRSEKAAASGSKLKWIILALVVLIIVVLAVILPVYFVVIRPRNNDNTSATSTPGHSSAQPSATAAPNPESPAGATTGGDGSRIRMENGTEFTYRNSYGGYWVSDPANPFDNSARSQSFSPALNETFRFGVDPIRGVNLGGWLITEPFIVPALYERYATATPRAVDEWTLSQAMAADTANGGLAQLEEHYRTFITEQDFADIAGAGLNFIRLPIGFWALGTWEGEPYLADVSWQYALKAFQWARKYGLRVNLDLHAMPGAQNEWWHSGKQGNINFLNGVMGYANAQRGLEYIRILTEFISQPEWRDVIVMFGIVNEPFLATIGREVLESFYYETHQIVRGITGLGEGNGPWISFHTGFTESSTWAGFLTGADRIAMDVHPYFAFDGSGGGPVDTYVDRPCTSWADGTHLTLNTFGMLTSGEFSSAINDCGLFLNGVGSTTQDYVGSCDDWTVWENWSDATKASIRLFTLASMDALQYWFFWTWRIGASTEAGSVRSPLWSYKLGLDNGWMPTDPRDSVGHCASRGHTVAAPFGGTFSEPWMTGGVGAGTIAAPPAWPPATLANAAGPVTLLPSYTATGAITTAPPPTFTVPGSQETIPAGDGWFNDADTTPGLAPIAGCTYPDAYSAAGIAVPAACGAAARKREAAPAPIITPPPQV